MAAELQGLQAGEERRGSNASQTGDSCLKALWQQGPNQVDAFTMLSSKGFTKVEQFRGSCHEEMKEEGIVKMNKSKVEPVSKWRCPCQAGPFKVHRLVVWSLIFLFVREAPGEGGSAGKSSTQGDRKRGPSRSPGRHSMDERGVTIWEDGSLKRKRVKKTAREPKNL